MPIFDIGLSDGRTLKLEATDGDTALGMANEWQAANPKISTTEDVVRSTGSGLQKAAIDAVSLPRSVFDVGYGAGRWVSQKLGLGQKAPSGEVETPIYNTVAPVFGPTHGQATTAVEGVAGPLHKSQSTLGKYADTTSRFALGVFAPGGLARRILGGVVAPGVGSEAAGQATEGSWIEPYARLGGAIAGGVVPSVFGRAVTPFPATAERTAAVNTLRAEGVDALTAGQATGRKRLQAVESELGGGRGATLMERQGEQFTAATLRRIGENETRATPEVLDRAYTRIGNQFETVSNRNTLNVDRRFANDFAQVQQDYNFLANPLQRQVIRDAIDDIIGVVQNNNGTIPGAQYQAMRSRLGAAARGTNDNQLRDAFYGLQRSLDDAMERSINAAGNRADVAAWREARNQYRNFLVIERAATSAGENAALGLISPAALRNATVNVHGRRNYATGQGDFEGLARAGAAVMSPLPNSGTPIRTSAWNMGMSPTGAGAGAALGASIGGPTGAAVGTVVGGYAPPVLGRAAVSAPGRAFLGNQVLADFLNNAPPMLQQAVINSILATTSQQRLPSPR